MSSGLPVVVLDHAYDAASNRLSRLDGREGASWANRDWEYSYDGLNRLTEARQGSRGGAGQTWTPSTGSQQWVLDMLGNWAGQRTDLSGNGLFTDALDRLDERAHNQANELSTRVLKKGDGSATTATLPLSYDAAGQMRQEQQSSNGARRYTHDAWGRLVKVESVNTSTQVVTPISTHRFNGLHWRIAKAWHAVADAQNKPDRKTTFWYDAAWRVIQENQVDQVNESGTLQEAVIQQFWGVRYIDDAVARLRLTGDGTGNVQAGSAEDVALQLTDAQFSVIAVATPGKPSVVIDRVAYTPYGEPTRTLRSDVNGDGVVNKDDYNTIIQPLIGTAIGSSGYVVEADLDRDGKISSDDYDVCIADDGQKSGGGVGETGLFSAGVRNSVGYCGYIHNEDTGLYTVRYRTYSATLGRWLTRDPAGYVDGMSLYQYAVGDPVTSVDPLGLDVGWAKRPGNDPYGDYLGCGCYAVLDWRGTWTPAEKTRLRLAIERSKHRAKQLIEQIDAIKASLSPCVSKELNPELDELRKRMADLVALLNNAGKTIKVYQSDLGRDVEAQTKGYRGLYNAFCELNNSSDPKSPNWLRMTLDTLSALLLHELSHIMEGSKDHDGSGKLYDLHNINMPGGFFYRDITDSGVYRALLMKAKKKCKEDDCDKKDEDK